MVVPVDREGKVGDCSLLHRDTCSSRSLEPVNTRIAGGRKSANRDDDEPHKVKMGSITIIEEYLLK